jgi:hypothetical protein
MARVPANQGRHPPQPVETPQPHRPRPRLRWGIVLVPLVCVAAAWVLHHVEPVFTWGDVLDRLYVRPQHYSRLAILGLTLIGVVAIKRVLQNDRRRDRR